MVDSAPDGTAPLQSSHFFTNFEKMARRDFLTGFELIVLLALLRVAALALIATRAAA
jgi:hypothetical protein